MKTNKKKGFTIVELVIVIAVIGILSAVLIPTFSGLVGKAKETALQADLRNAYTVYAEQAATEEEYEAQEDVYFCKDATLDGDSDLYQYTANGTYEKLATPTIANYEVIKLGEPATAVVYNGYYAYKVTPVTPGV